MAEWEFAQKRSDERLAKLSQFSYTKKQDDQEIEFRITVHEYAQPEEPGMRFYAVSDLQTNQSTAPFTPCGWGISELLALEHCIRAIQRFPYEGSTGNASD